MTSPPVEVKQVGVGHLDSRCLVDRPVENRQSLFDFILLDQNLALLQQVLHLLDVVLEILVHVVFLFLFLFQHFYYIRFTLSSQFHVIDINKYITHENSI